MRRREMKQRQKGGKYTYCRALTTSQASQYIHIYFVSLDRERSSRDVYWNILLAINNDE